MTISFSLIFFIFGVPPFYVSHILAEKEPYIQTAEKISSKYQENIFAKALKKNGCSDKMM